MTSEPTTALSPADEIPNALKEHLTPLPAVAIRARQRVWAIFHVYLYELIASLVIATPAYAWASRSVGGHPDGDAILWQAGGHYLASWLLETGPSLAIVSRTSITLVVVTMVAMQIPLGALLASLAFARDDDTPGLPDPGRSMRWPTALRIGMTSFMPLAGLLVLSLIVIVILGGAGFFVSNVVSQRFEAGGEVKAFEWRLAMIALFGMIIAYVGVIVDFARAAIARGVAIAVVQQTPVPALVQLGRGLKVAFRTARRSLFRAFLAWSWRAALGILLVAVGYSCAQALGGKGGGVLAGLWAIHQLITFARTALRASWLARALQLTERGASGTPARTADRPAPSRGRAA